MARNRRSAKAAGSGFEQDIADYLAEHWDDHIERRTKHGAKDRGDIANFRVGGRRVVIEAKEYGGRFLVGTWLSEARTEALNDGAALGIVAAKRKGTTKPGEQVVFMTMDDLVQLLTLAGGWVEGTVRQSQ